MEDCIIVSQLEILARVGVTAVERVAEQRLTVFLRLEPVRGFAGLDDDLANTVDYVAVCEAVREEAVARPRQLIETLAEEVAAGLLSGFPLKAVEVEVRKYVLTDAECVAVRIRRECEG